MSVCSSPAFLQRMRDRAMARGLPALADHLDAAMRTWVAEPLRLYRTVEDCPIEPGLRYAELEAARDLRLLSAANCHDGQRKLTMALLEFIAGAVTALRCAPSDLMVVYAGASGLASAVAATVFPDARFVLYDPDPSVVRLLPRFPGRTEVVKRRGQEPDPSKNNVVIFTGDAGWFDDEAARRCRESLLPASGRRLLLFVSDIRAGTSEPEIARDMVDQMRWTVLAGAHGYMLKFRPPYLDDTNRDGILASYEQGVAAAVGRPLAPGVGLPYLGGHMYIQLHGRQRTMELRLVGAPRRDGRYVVRRYDVGAIEDKMAVFNAAYRAHAVFSHGRARGPYEEVAETAIMALCARAGGGGRGRAGALRGHVDELVAQFIAKDIATCPVMTAAARVGELDAETLAYIRECAGRLAPGALPQWVDGALSGRARR